MSNKVPQIRFNGYSDAWEQRKSSAIFHTITDFVANGSFASLRENVSYSDKLDYAIVVRLTDYSNGYKGPFLYTSKSGYDFLKKSSLNPNDILISNVGANAGLVFKAPILDVPMTLGPNSILVRTSDQDHEFMYQLMRSTTGEHLIKTQIGISAQPKFNKTEFKQIIFTIPKSQEEQQKIGNLFHELDHTIALHQRRLDLLKEQKKGYLQKMFPKNGEKVPELRFAGFADDWEERKLSDIADRFDNLRVPITASDRKSGDTPYYGANGIQDYVEGFTHDGEFILVAEDGANDLKNYPVQYVNGKVWVNNHAHVLQGKNTITDNKFLMNSIKNFNIEPFLVGGGRAKLNADVMMKLNVLLPTFEEQEKIGSFFKQLDDTITLHQRKLDLLKEQKKGFLQKMFV